MLQGVILQDVRLAQLDRAFGYGPKGRGFESSNARFVRLSTFSVCSGESLKAGIPAIFLSGSDVVFSVPLLFHPFIMKL